MRSTVAVAIAVMIPVMAVAGPLFPPLDRDPLLPELANTVRRHDVVAEASAGDIARVQAAFLAGSWAAFETWAELALAGRTPAASPPATPHGTFWAMVLARPPGERDAFVRFVVRARPLHA